MIRRLACPTRRLRFAALSEQHKKAFVAMHTEQTMMEYIGGALSYRQANALFSDLRMSADDVYGFRAIENPNNKGTIDLKTLRWV